MIITCETCSTSFNLDNLLLPEEGTKVRCSVCKKIFMVYPQTSEEETAQEESSIAFPDDDLYMDDDPPMEDDSFIEDDPFDDSQDEYEQDGYELDEYELNDDELADDEFLLDDDEFAIDDDHNFDTDDTDFQEDDSFNFEDDEYEVPTQNEDYEIQIQKDEPDLGMEIDAEDNEIELELEPQSDEALYETDEDTPYEISSDDLEIETEPSLSVDAQNFEPTQELSVEEDAPYEIEEEAPELEINAIDDEPEMELSLEDDDNYFSIIEEEPAEAEPEPEYEQVEPQLSLDVQEDQSMTDGEFELEIDSPKVEEKPKEPEVDIMDSFHPLEPGTPQDPDADTPSALLPEENNFAEYDKVLKQETDPSALHIDDEDADITPGHVEITDKNIPSLAEEIDPLMTRSVKRKRQPRKAKPIIGTPVLILFLLFLLITSAYVASLMTGYKIPYLSDLKVPYIEEQLKRLVPQIAEAKPKTNQKTINGRFVTNVNSGTLFVITGRVKNDSEVVFKHIQIRGALIIKDKVEAVTKTAFCGNIITEDMLKNGQLSEMEKILNNKSGNHDSNLSVKPLTSIPFMIVFSNLPEKLENFTVKIKSFEKEEATAKN